VPLLPADENGSIRQALPVARLRFAAIAKFLNLNLVVKPDFLILACYNNALLENEKKRRSVGLAI
jgi:hypothetical protein